MQMKPISTIKARLNLESNGKVHKYFQNDCYRHMGKFTPRDQGNLNKNVDLSDANYIIYESPYAHYQYEGNLYVMENGKGAYYDPKYGFWSKKGEKKTKSNRKLHYHTAGTGDHWDKRMWSAEGKQVIKEVQDFVNRGCV